MRNPLDNSRRLRGSEPLDQNSPGSSGSSENRHQRGGPAADNANLANHGRARECEPGAGTRSATFRTKLSEWYPTCALTMTLTTASAANATPVRRGCQQQPAPAEIKTGGPGQR